MGLVRVLFLRLSKKKEIEKEEMTYVTAKDHEEKTSLNTNSNYIL